MDRMMEHTIQTLTVDAYSSDGAGVARLDGAAVFVAGCGVRPAGSTWTRWDALRSGAMWWRS